MAQAFVLPLFFQVGLGFSAFDAGVLLLAQNGGDLILKPVTGKAVRRMGFRTALTSGAVTMVVSIAACAFLTSTMPFWLMALALFVVGMARSILFTGMMALTFAEVSEEEMSGATVLNNLANSMTAALAVSLTALALNLSATFHLGALWTLGEYRIPILLLAATGVPAIFLFARMPRNAGAELRGQHRPIGLSLE